MEIKKLTKKYVIIGEEQIWFLGCLVKQIINYALENNKGILKA